MKSKTCNRILMLAALLAVRALAATTMNYHLDTADFGKPPAPTQERPHPRPAPVPGTFHLLVYEG